MMRKTTIQKRTLIIIIRGCGTSSIPILSSSSLLLTGFRPTLRYVTFQFVRSVGTQQIRNGSVIIRQFSFP
jgi:hypothetical protein